MYSTILKAISDKYGSKNFNVISRVDGYSLTKTTINIKQLPNWNIVLWSRTTENDKYADECISDSEFNFTSMYLMHKKFPEYNNITDAKPLLIRNVVSTKNAISLIEYVRKHRLKAYKTVANIDNGTSVYDRENEFLYTIKKWISKNINHK